MAEKTPLEKEKERLTALALSEFRLGMKYLADEDYRKSQEHFEKQNEYLEQLNNL